MYNSPGISIALIFITVGIGFKLSPATSRLPPYADKTPYPCSWGRGWSTPHNEQPPGCRGYGVEIAHVRDRRIPLVKRVAFSGKQSGSFLIRYRHVRRRTASLQWLDIRVEYQLVRWPCPLGSRKCETRPNGLRRRATCFFGRKSLVCNLVVKGRISY